MFNKWPWGSQITDKKYALPYIVNLNVMPETQKALESQRVCENRNRAFY